MKRYNIGLIGFGCVGQGFYEVLKANPEISAEVVKIAVRDASKERSVDKDIFVYNTDKLIEDDAIDIVVELIDDAETAFKIVEKALSKGKPVVSANKKMIAERFEELVFLQNKHATPILYEGAVCGSIPILQTLDRYYKSENIKSIRGIFNGSTNYILTKIVNENLSYSSALSLAQKNGFAETNPLLDVGGFDPKFKLAILVNHAFSQSIHPNQIVHWGIDNLSKEDFDFAKANNLRIKLVAIAEVQDNTLSLLVAPHFVDASDLLFHIENENNGVIIKGEFAGQQTLIGKGAGSLPTGLAVLADVNSIIKGASYGYAENSFLQLSNKSIDLYLRYPIQSDFTTDLFESISEKSAGKDSSYVIGRIKLSRLKTILNLKGVNAIILTTERSELQTVKLSYSYAS